MLQRHGEPPLRTGSNLVSMALNTLGVQLDAGLEGFARWRR